MSPLPPPQIVCERHHPVLVVGDIIEAIDFYTKKLGFREGFLWGEPPTFAGVDLDRVSIFLRMGAPNNCAYEVTFVVGNADELYEFQRANGVEVLVPIADRLYEIRDYRVRDLYGNHLTFGHAL
jgi:catechol 2,3-dioxygenase-like lactoylglutathione lyase family enzyme